MGMYGEVTAASKEQFGKLSNGDSFAGLFPSRTTTADSVSLEKAWHGIHYLLTGEQWGGQGPLAFLLSGGKTSGDEGPRWFTPEESKAIHKALTDVSDEVFWSRFDASKMEELEIYPIIWDEEEEELQEEYLMYLNDLKQVVELAAESDRGLVVSIS